jgi:predicted O-methyltransferase YrrM
VSSQTLALTDTLYNYLVSVSVREPEVLKNLREETRHDPMARMQVSPEQGQFMALLVSLLGARKCLEIGTYTGYSALWVALALPADGKLIACDISEKWTTVARRHWRNAGVAHKVELRLAPALDTLRALLSGGEPESFDFAFIDADKTNYLAYYEAVLKLIRPRGLIAVDNVLWDGQVADPRINDETTLAIRHFNQRLFEDPRIRLSLLPLGDGLTLAQKI